MSGAPGEGRPYVVRREAWDALVARAEAAEARVEELLVKWSEAKYATESAEAERDKARLLTEAEKEISAGAIQAMRAAEAKVTALEAALREHVGLLERYTGRPRDKAWTLQPEAADLMFRTLAALDRQETMSAFFCVCGFSWEGVGEIPDHEHEHVVREHERGWTEHLEDCALDRQEP